MRMSVHLRSSRLNLDNSDISSSYNHKSDQGKLVIINNQIESESDSEQELQELGNTKFDPESLKLRQFRLRLKVHKDYLLHDKPVEDETELPEHILGMKKKV